MLRTNALEHFNIIGPFNLYEILPMQFKITEGTSAMILMESVRIVRHKGNLNDHDKCYLELHA